MYVFHFIIILLVLNQIAPNLVECFAALLACDVIRKSRHSKFARRITSKACLIFSIFPRLYLFFTVVTILATYAFEISILIHVEFAVCNVCSLLCAR